MASKEQSSFVCGYFSCYCGISQVGCGGCPCILNHGSRMRVVSFMIQPQWHWQENFSRTGGSLDHSMVLVCYGVITAPASAHGLYLLRYSSTLEKDDASLYIHNMDTMLSKAICTVKWQGMKLYLWSHFDPDIDTAWNGKRNCYSLFRQSC
jgi:hypothetical protein